MTEKVYNIDVPCCAWCGKEGLHQHAVEEIQRLNSSAYHITLYDLSGAPLPPDAVEEMTETVDRLAKAHNLVTSIKRG